MPRNVKRFALLWVSSFLIQLPTIFLQPTSDAATLGISSAADQKLAAAGFLLFAVLLPFLLLAVWKRKNWARWLLFVVFLVCLPLLFVSPEFQPDYIAGTALAFLSQVAEAVGSYFVFTGDARPWFAR